MKMSNRERNLLMIVLTVAVGLLYYKFVYTPQSEKLANKKTERSAIELEYEADKQEIAKIDARKASLTKLKVEADEATKNYYPQIIQEKLIKEVTALMTKNNLQGDYSWKEADAQPLVNLTPAIIELPKSSLQALADVVKGDLNASKDDKQTGNKAETSTAQNTETSTASTSTASASTSTASANTANSATANASGEASGPTPVKMVLTIKITSGNYESIKNFVTDIKKYDRVVVSPALTMEGTTESQCTGQIDIEFYSIPKINDEDNEYLEWK